MSVVRIGTAAVNVHELHNMRRLALCGLLLSCGLMLDAAPSQWADLGSGFTGNAAVAANSDGRLEAFVRGTDNAIWHLSQTSPGGSAWTAPQSLGGTFTSDPAVGMNTDGTLEVFGVGADNALWHNRQTSAGSSNWSGWKSLGGQVRDQPSVAVNADGRLEVFLHTTSNSTWHYWEGSPSGSFTGNDEIVGDVVAAPSSARNSDGRLIMYVGDSDGKFWWVIQNSAGADSWSPWWCLLGGTVTAPVVGTNSDRRVQLFAVRSDSSVWTSAQTAAGSYSYTDWTALGGSIMGDVSAATDASGRMEVFGPGTDTTLYYASQTSPGGSWSGWNSLGGTLTGTVTAARNADGRLEVFAVGAGNVLRHIAQSSPGVWSAAAAGPPVLSTVENGASFVQGQAVAPGSYVALVGNNFAPGLTVADFTALPLPTSLGGASVSFNGIPAPLVAVSGNQLNAQVPWGVLAGGGHNATAQVVVHTGAGNSSVATVALTTAAPGLFTIADSGGSPRPAVYNNSDITLPLSTSISVPGYRTRPAKVNEILILFATGLGAVNNQPGDGAPGLAQPPFSTTVAAPTVLVGGVPQKVLFSGLSPQYPSMYQVAFIIQPGTPTGDAVPLQLQMNGVTTTDQLKIAVSN